MLFFFFFFLSFNQGQKAWEWGQKQGVGRDCASYRRGKGIWSPNPGRRARISQKRGEEKGQRQRGVRRADSSRLPKADCTFSCTAGVNLHVVSKLESPALVLSSETALCRLRPIRPAPAPSPAAPLGQGSGAQPGSCQPRCCCWEEPSRASCIPLAWLWALSCHVKWLREAEGFTLF